MDVKLVDAAAPRKLVAVINGVGRMFWLREGTRTVLINGTSAGFSQQTLEQVYADSPKDRVAVYEGDTITITF